MASGEPIPPDVELDLARYELRRGGRVERLEKIPMELLILLAERRGQLVTRPEILERLWGKDVFVDADAAINTAVRKVRRAPGDDPREVRESNRPDLGDVTGRCDASPHSILMVCTAACGSARSLPGRRRTRCPGRVETPPGARGSGAGASSDGL